MTKVKRKVSVCSIFPGSEVYLTTYTNREYGSWAIKQFENYNPWRQEVYDFVSKTHETGWRSDHWHTSLLSILNTVRIRTVSIIYKNLTPEAEKAQNICALSLDKYRGIKMFFVLLGKTGKLLALIFQEG